MAGIHGHIALQLHHRLQAGLHDWCGGELEVAAANGPVEEKVAAEHNPFLRLVLVPQNDDAGTGSVSGIADEFRCQLIPLQQCPPAQVFCGGLERLHLGSFWGSHQNIHRAGSLALHEPILLHHEGILVGADDGSLGPLLLQAGIAPHVVVMAMGVQYGQRLLYLGQNPVSGIDSRVHHQAVSIFLVDDDIAVSLELPAGTGQHLEIICLKNTLVHCFLHKKRD